jgi:hypothetical protein
MWSNSLPRWTSHNDAGENRQRSAKFRPAKTSRRCCKALLEPGFYSIHTTHRRSGGSIHTGNFTKVLFNSQFRITSGIRLIYWEMNTSLVWILQEQIKIASTRHIKGDLNLWHACYRSAYVLPVLYGCVNWRLILRGGHMVFWSA